ncbi:MAG TPA: NADP-dependent oxidoreductase [Lacisediminihabitans sp.]|uniref:NADP-dependent oxidoreductase n=1 Tax=Lacisediminihabitans sp. TaxID=2787631 RepID=UPI002EDB4AA3
MSRVVMVDRFGGPEVLSLRSTPEPHAGPGEVRVHVRAIGLNPMDWMVAASPRLAAAFGVSLPAGFAHDFAGTVDEVGDGSLGYTLGDRVFGSVPSRAAADHLLIGAGDLVFRTPAAISDEIASTLPVAGLTAVAAVAAVRPGAGDTLLVGGAAGGVGVFAVQLARLRGAQVLGTGSPSTESFLRDLGAEPIAYGPGLEQRLAASGFAPVTAAIDLYGTEVVHAALELGVAPARIAAVAAGGAVPAGVRVTGAAGVEPGAMDTIVDALLTGRLRVPIAASFPIERIHDAVRLQATRHVHGKVVVTI